MWTVKAVPRPSVLVDGRSCPPVQLHQLLHEGEPDAGPFVRPRARALDAVEPIVEVRDVLGGDPDAGVLDAQDGGAVGGAQRHADRRPRT